MKKQKVILIVLFAVIFFIGSLYFYLQSREEVTSDYDWDGEGRDYINEDIGYKMKYPITWIMREREDLTSFYSFREERDLQTSIDLSTYDQFFSIDLVGRSPLTYIDGDINYDIKKGVYLNSNEFTVRQWYDVVVLLEAYTSRKISEGEFTKLSNEVLKEGSLVTKEAGIFDPWTPRGDVVNVGGKDVLMVTRPARTRYDGYQYYIVSLEDNIFVFYFGYGGLVLPREMWHRSDMHIR